MVRVVRREASGEGWDKGGMCGERGKVWQGGVCDVM